MSLLAAGLAGQIELHEYLLSCAHMTARMDFLTRALSILQNESSVNPIKTQMHSFCQTADKLRTNLCTLEQIFSFFALKIHGRI